MMIPCLLRCAIGALLVIALRALARRWREPGSLWQ